MVDISALMRGIPVSGLEPQWVASIDLVDVPREQAWKYNIPLLEPPAGQHFPYIEPVRALEILMLRQGVAPDEAKIRSINAGCRMKADVVTGRWVNFFDDIEPESPECLSVGDFVAWLRNETWVPSEITDFLMQVADVSAETPMFSGPDNWNEPWSLKNLPDLPPPKAMIEFVPGMPWYEFERNPDETPFLAWREMIRPTALALEKSLGEEVYYFKELDDEMDDDDVHRFLVLHWCCTYKPESAYVRYLLRISGARDVEELKAALIDQASYSHPFKMNNSFRGMEARRCNFIYVPPDVDRH